MLHFDSDYMRGAALEIMAALIETNMEQTTGYGTDRYTRMAQERILEDCGIPQGKVYFLEGGTQTNATVIDGLLRGTQGVVAAEQGHINVHEAGAVEAWGHKVLALPSADGKLTAEQLAEYLGDFYADETWEHMVQPGMVYLSQPTEYGLLYSKAELTAIKEVCTRYSIPLYVDGARLGYALASDKNDVTLRDMAAIADVFYIGGTKVGALFGEAVVMADGKLIPNFFSLTKQHGALLAKGRMLGLQFLTLFTDGLYECLGRNGVRMAMRLRKAMAAKGYRPHIDSPTNQQFFSLPNRVIDRLSAKATFEYWGPRGEHESLVRFVTDWATTEAEIDALAALL